MSVHRRVQINGEWYTPVLLRVEDWREDEPYAGLPSGATILMHEDVIELSDDLMRNVFHLAFVKEDAIAFRRNSNGEGVFPDV